MFFAGLLVGLIAGAAGCWMLYRACMTARLENAALNERLESERRAEQERDKLHAETQARLKSEFENLANRIFDEKGRAFSEKNNEALNSLLNPLKEQINHFRQRIDQVHSDETRARSQLLEQVRQLRELNTQVSAEALNLTRAIKGDSKKQGTWGELVIERILEASGLERGREFETQAALKDESGRRLQPDFLVHLPGERVVIIDSKVSLTAYERFSSAGDDDQSAALREHVESVRRHVKELAAKSYQDVLQGRTLDFVLMCVPVEPAYQAALQADETLLELAAESRIVLTGPSTLMLMLKMIAGMWRQDRQNRHALEIAEKAGNLYDKFVGFAEALELVGTRLASTQDAYDTAFKRLKSGTGNLVRRAEELRRLGAKASKQLSSKLLDSEEEEY